MASAATSSSRIAMKARPSRECCTRSVTNMKTAQTARKTK